MSDHEKNPLVRTVASTQSEMTEIILPNDTNTLGNLLGGRLMHFIDLTGAMAAYRHSRTNVVTAAMDHIDFVRPVHLGDLLTLSAYLVFVAIDEQGRLIKVPELKPETPDEIRRYHDALLRREHREAESARRKQASLATSALTGAATEG